MADNSWPSTAHNARAVTDAEYERIHVRGTDDGLYGDPTDAAIVTAGTGLQVVVKANKGGHLRGHNWTSGSTDYTHTVTANVSGSTRTDRVVLRLDRDDQFKVRTAVKAGTPGAGAPALQQDTGSTGKYEIPVALVTVPNNASSVTVTRDELWVGSRIRPCTSSTRPTIAKRGDVCFETDTGKWVGFNGTGWVSIYEYTGKIALGLGYSAWSHYAANFGMRQGGLATIRVAVRRVSAGTFTASDPDGSYIATLPTVLRPVDGATHHFAGMFTNEALCRLEVRADGEIWVKNNTKDVPINTALALTMTYPIGV